MIRIVYLEDSAELLAAFQDYIKNRHAGQIEIAGTASDGSAGLELTRNVKPDLVLTDIVMPFMDGLSFLDALRKDPVTKNIPCIVVSAMGNERNVAGAMAAGADYFIAKPFDFEYLCFRIFEVLRTAKKHKEPQTRADGYTDQRVTAALNKAGFVPSGKSYYFLRQGIALCLKDESYLDEVTKRLYGDIAALFNTSAERVERSIRYLIDKLWDENGCRKYFEALGLTDPDMIRKPSNASLMMNIVHLINSGVL